MKYKEESKEPVTIEVEVTQSNPENEETIDEQKAIVEKEMKLIKIHLRRIEQSVEAVRTHLRTITELMGDEADY